MGKPRLLLVGAGKLGAYHLQGLAKIEEDVSLDVFDPSLDSLANAKTLFETVENSYRHNIRFLSEIVSLNDDYDLGINATTSGFRAQSIVATGHLARCWLIEKILSQNVQQIDKIEECLSNGQKAWVNHMLRELDWVQDAKKGMEHERITHFETIGKDWSLACNVVHHIDLVAWLSGGNLASFDTSGLDKKWFASKRRGHFELFGSAKATFDNGVAATFTSSEQGKSRVSRIFTDKQTWLMDEVSASIMSGGGQVFSGVFERQSKLTKKLAESILSGSSLNLPSLQFAANLHRIYISSMLSHWNKTMNSSDKAIPIT